MKILIVCSGKDIEVLSLMGPLSKITGHQVDLLIPGKFKAQMQKLSNISGVMSLSDFGIQDVFGWRKIPGKITALLTQSYDKIIDLSITVLNPGYAIDDTIDKCAGLYAAELDAQLGGSHDCSFWLDSVPVSTLPENAVVIEPLDYAYWLDGRQNELNKFVEILRSFGVLIVTNTENFGDLKLNLSLYDYVKIMAGAKNLILMGGLLSKVMSQVNDNNVMNWSNVSVDSKKPIVEVMISIPTTTDIEKFLTEEQTWIAPIDIEKAVISYSTSDLEFVRSQFRNYCCRNPSNIEVLRHMEALKTKSRAQMNQDFAYCEEAVVKGRYTGSRLAVPVREHRGPLKVAVLLCGHLRTYETTYPSIVEKLVRPLGADVFIHTWNKIGTQIITQAGPVPDEQAVVNPDRIRALIPDLKGLVIEDNAKFLASAKMRGRAAVIYGQSQHHGWIGLSADPVNIESQLYSMSGAFDCMKQYADQHGSYDLVIRLRSDLLMSTGLPELGVLDTNTIWIPNPPNNNHDHPACFACQMGPHEGEHASDVCDIFAYGSQNAMEKYCGLWKNLEAVWTGCEEENAITFKLPLSSGKVGIHQAVNIWSSPNAHRVNCFYPERLFRKYLKGYRLMGSKMGTKVLR